jgi:geranylgeranyl diphosphate synthase type I
MLPSAPTSSLGEDFPTLLAGARAEVDRRLAAFWDEKLTALHACGPEVVAMAAAARDLTLRGGKRYRAALLAAAYAAVAPDAPIGPALQAGVAVELLQSYLLIQDDWIDGDATRRGGPSAHAALSASLGDARLGAASAILASDLTLDLALGALSAIDLTELAPSASEPPERRVLAAIKRFLRINEDAIIGQQLDLIGSDDVETMHDLKTGSYTVRGPLVLGAVLAGAPAATIAALERFATPVGLAFQLRDDLLGAFGSAAETGKPEGSDLRNGKRTAILAEAEARLTAEQRRAVDRVLGRAGATPAEVAEATAALDACGARAAVSARQLALCEAAEALAMALPLDARARGLIAGAATALRPSHGGAASGPTPEVPAHRG